jgi:NADP-dependent 3-hydroxy acid dehydrogenase YdfG
MNKKALVTGATSGIGFEAAKQLINDGWQVLGLGRSASKQSVPAGVIPYPVNLLDENIEKEILQAVTDKLGGLDLLVNNAGVSWVGPFSEMSNGDIDRVFGINVRSVMILSREMIPLLQESQGGQIITVASIAADYPMETLAAYCASKAAIVMFSQVLARELAEHQVRVNVLSPCGTDTNIFETVGVEIDKNTLVPADEMAALIVLLTQLPAHVDVSELKINKRFSVLV